MPLPFDRSAPCQSWAPYVRHLADLLRLRDWTVELSNDPPPDDSVAMVHITHGRRHALIDVSDDFLAENEISQRHTIAHELIHCHVEPANIIAKALGEARYADFLLCLEYAVDGLADAVAPLLPLPSDVPMDVE